MTKQRRSNFRGKVADDAKRQKRSGGFSYLNLPKEVKVLSLKEGTKTIDLDFLPYVITDDKHPDYNKERSIALKGDLWYKRPFKVHRNIGADNITVVCPTSIGERCPICEYRTKLLNQGAKWDDETVKALRPSPRNLYIVIPIGNKDLDEVPYVWDMAQFLFQDILNEELEINEENEVFPDLEEGKTAQIKLKWEEFGKGTFPKVRSIDFSDRDPYKESILDEVPNLDELLTVPNYDEMKEKFFELGTEEPAEETDDDTTSDRHSKYRKEKEDKDDDAEEEAPEDKPTTRQRTTRRDEDDKNQEQEEEPKKEKVKDHPRRTRTKDSEDNGKEKNKCPSGFTFGKDWDSKKACDSCDDFDACMDEYDKKK